MHDEPSMTTSQKVFPISAKGNLQLAPSWSAQQTAAIKKSYSKSIRMRQETHPYDGHYIVAQFPQTTFPKDEQYDQKKLSVKCENMTIRAEIYAHQSPNKLNQH